MGCWQNWILHRAVTPQYALALVVRIHHNPPFYNRERNMEQIWERSVFVNGIEVMRITGNVRQVQQGNEDQFQSLVQLDFQGIKVFSHASCHETRQQAVDDVYGMLGTIYCAQKQD
jgi:hypothetical protein